MKKECILCEGTTTICDRLDFSLLEGLYLKYFQIKIKESIALEFHDAELTLLECETCQIQFFWPILSGKPNFYSQLGKNKWYYGAEKWEFNLAMEKLSNAVSVLEVGCGSGKFLKLLKREQKKVVGLEFNPSALESLRAEGYEVYSTDAESFSKMDGRSESFDAVCSFQVLEHVEDPRSFFRGCIDCLKPGGTLLVSVPNRDGFTKLGTNNLLDMPPHHVTRWNSETMKACSKFFGLDLTNLEYEPIALYHRKWYRMLSLQSAISGRVGFDLRSLTAPNSFKFWLLKVAALILEFLIPNNWWNYGKYSGHTFCVIFTKPLREVK